MDEMKMILVFDFVVKYIINILYNLLSLYNILLKIINKFYFVYNLLKCCIIFL